MSVKLIHADCMEILPTLPENSLDSIVTDPPYGIQFMNKRWDYDVPSVELWAEVLRVLKPGGYMLAFSSARTYHRMVVAVEDAGFEIRDQLCWLNGQGMPHGLDVGKAVAKAGGEGWEGWNTTLKGAMEPIVLAQKPLDGTVVQNVLKHGVGGMNIDESRIPIDPEVDDPRLGGQGSWSTSAMAKNAYGDFAGDRVGSSPLGRFPTNVLLTMNDKYQLRPDVNLVQLTELVEWLNGETKNTNTE